MRYQFTSPAGQNIFNWGRPRSNMIRTLIMINGAIWLLLLLTGTNRIFFQLFGLVPKMVWSNLMIWQPVTYMFLHAGFWHIFLNMFVLWMFGSELERIWGGRQFLRYYFLTGVGAGIVTLLFSLASTIPVVGASGAIYGVLLAYGLTFPERLVYLYFLFPVKVKYFVAFLGAMAFLASLQPGRSPVSDLTHLSGMAIGYVYLKSGFRLNIRKLGDLLVSHHQGRLRKKAADERYAEFLLRQQVDKLLDKITTSGYDSLTKAEQSLLRRASIKFSRKSEKN